MGKQNQFDNEATLLFRDYDKALSHFLSFEDFPQMIMIVLLLCLMIFLLTLGQLEFFHTCSIKSDLPCQTLTVLMIQQVYAQQQTAVWRLCSIINNGLKSSTVSKGRRIIWFDRVLPSLLSRWKLFTGDCTRLYFACLGKSYHVWLEDLVELLADSTREYFNL